MRQPEQWVPSPVPSRQRSQTDWRLGQETRLQCLRCGSRGHSSPAGILDHHRAPFPLYAFANNLAPINLLLQLDFGKSIVSSQPPLQLVETGLSPSSLKLGCSGRTPVSTTPTMTSLTCWGSGRSGLDSSRPRNRGVRVVWTV
ncbi:RING/FYVE/PHD zinc finger superfamily protein [Striga asiatica]|uniref:RING/FYVE/PHD zinc finger superfamily protein n=1 Tax=Striga asiatica TaxID=4170 RepID=A0A5A7QRR2_STRAF|nr:RING/FYVE/PHD zinc finger superfamily protein [Striga asiatica]